MTAAPDWEKDPDAVLDYAFKWSDWLTSGEIIASSTMIVSAGIVANSDSFTDTVATIWLSGGTTGKPYTITNRITTNQGRTDDRTAIIRVTDR